MNKCKKIVLVALLFSTAPMQAEFEKPNYASTGWGSGVGKTVFVSLLINTVAACTKDNFIPMKAFAPAAIIMGGGMAALGYLDDKALKKNPACGSNKRNSIILNSLVVAAALTPIVLSNSESGALLRKTLKPVGERVLSAGTKVADAILLGMTLGK